VSENPASSRSDAQENLMARVDTSVPVSARIWNYWMGLAMHPAGGRSQRH